MIEDYPVASGETYLVDDVSIELAAQTPALVAGVQIPEASAAAAGPTATAATARAAHVFAASLYPNPMRADGALRYSLTRPGPVKAALFDARGRRVRTLVDEAHAEAGSHGARIDGRGADGDLLPAGIYFYRIETGEGCLSGRLVLLK